MRRLTAGAAVALLGWGGALGASRVLAGTGGGCEDIGDESPMVDGFPERMSSLVGADIRTGAHECFERVVIEFAGTGELPGYAVRYESGPLTESPSDLPVDVAGDTALLVSFGAWMPDMEGTGYGGPTQITPTNVDNILELRQLENFEGQSQWAIGLDRERGFRVSTLADPVRIVIDIEVDASEAPPATTESPGTTAPGSTAVPASTSPPDTTPPAPSVPSVPSMADHPLIGAWVFVDDSDPDAPPVLLAFHADGTSQQTDGGVTGFGSWEPTGATSALATIVVPVVDPDGATVVSTYRAELDVSADGATLAGRYTIELAGPGMPAGEFGPGTGTATRIEPEPLGTPVGSLDDLRTLLAPESSTVPTTTP